MELRQLVYFAAISKTGSITGAAKLLHVAQPAVSMAIKKLENELDTQLLHRKENGVTPTFEGLEFLQHCNQILQQAEDAKLSMKYLGELAVGEVTIGMPSMIGSYFFPPILMAFRHKYPNIQINDVDDMTLNIRDKLLNNELDIGVVASQYLTPELDHEIILREEIVIGMAIDHPLASNSSISARELLSHDLALSHYHRMLIEEISKTENVVPKISFTSELLPLIKNIIRQGYGISPIFESGVRDEELITTRPLEKPIYVELSLAWKRGKYLSKANSALKRFVLENVECRQAAVPAGLETDFSS
ncbi:LysR family transcriptional regulator [uncultured Cohaesibacter sp.]|uniref:LysR family transcriptional regulator n=1 Tax=uncultured Cohaesibacter sp. TaxID=1002546 RepID=UPI00292FABD6|nr:LysR family transcriptional regulator [uncultured Cohaesibacter sp.]